MIYNLNKRLVEKLRKIGIIICALLIGGLACYKGCWITEEAFNPSGKQAESYMELENDISYEVKWLCLSRDLEYISYDVLKPDDGKGRITVSVENKKGDVISEEYTFTMSDFTQSELQLPTYMKETPHLGQWYTLKICVSERENLESVKIKTGRNVNAVSYTINEEGKLQKNVAVVYHGNTFVGIINYIRSFVLAFAWCALVFCKKKWRITYVSQKELLSVIFAGLNFVLIELAAAGTGTISLVSCVENIFIIYLFQEIFYLVLRRQTLVIRFSSVLLFMFGATEYYVMQFRGTPFVPWDLRVAGTAVTVAKSYHLAVPYSLMIAFLFLMIVWKMAGMFVVQISDIRRKRSVSALILILALNLLIGDKIIYPKLEANLWSIQENYDEHGVIASFCAYTKYMWYNKPENYSELECEKIIEDAGTIEGSSIKARNVIIIMNESFSDLRVVNDKLVGNEYMPFIDSLKENTIKGNLYVPVYGAGTSNSEFEVLTGVSTRYTPSTPYVTTVNKDLDSLCRRFTEDGFKSVAFHPYFISNWNRNRAYPHLGFQELYDMSNMDEPTMVRWCISDRSDYAKLIELYEENKGQPFFMFNVTMQNHGGYEEDYANFPPTVDLSEYGDFPQAENYFSLVKESDSAFEALVHYFEKVDEPTLICFFGDHQPSIEQSYYELLYGKKMEELSSEELEKRYQTPFVIWTNYKMESGEIDKISANYLGDLVLLASGRDLEGFEAYTYQLYKKYPVISVNGIYDTEGNYYVSEDQIDDNLLKEYQCMSYYRMKTTYKR